MAGTLYPVSSSILDHTPSCVMFDNKGVTEHLALDV